MLLTVPHTAVAPARPGLPGLTEGASLLLWETARRHSWSGEGALSLKSFPRGCAHYRVDGRSYALGPTHFLVLNRGQSYRVDIDARQPTESFCLFFARDLAADVSYVRRGSHAALLDNPRPASLPPVHFFEKPCFLDGPVQQYLLRLQHQLRTPGLAADAFTEPLHGLLSELLRRNGDARAEMDALPFVRAATREELYRRLHVARQYIYDAYPAPLTLPELARVACLSPNHLLRTFRQLFGQSPFQLLTRVRLEKARELLVRTDAPVAEVCTAVGFASLSSFTGLFKRTYGAPPHGYRQQKR
jgi:AraC-like DNA-binding protein